MPNRVLPAFFFMSPVPSEMVCDPGVNFTECHPFCGRTVYSLADEGNITVRRPVFGVVRIANDATVIVQVVQIIFLAFASCRNGRATGVAGGSGAGSQSLCRRYPELSSFCRIVTVAVTCIKSVRGFMFCARRLCKFFNNELSNLLNSNYN